MKKHFLFVFSNRYGQVEPELLSSLEKYKHDHPNFIIEHVVTQHAGHSEQIIRSFAQKYPDSIIVVAGGDGSLNEAVNVMMQLDTNAALCPVPYGTSNDFCKLLYKKFNFDDFLKDLEFYQISKIDLIKLEGQLSLLGAGPDTVNANQNEIIESTYVLNVASLGLDSEILRSTFQYMARYPALNTKSYYLAILKHFMTRKLKTWNLTFRFDDKKISSNCLLAAFCNGGFYGNGFNPAPNCILDDGKLNYCIAPEFNHIHFANLSVKYKKGKIMEDKKIMSGTFEKVRIVSDDGKPVLSNFDGILFESSDYQISIRKKVFPLVYVGEMAQKRLQQQRDH